MERTPEPELMDDEAQALAYANADFSASDRAFVEAFLERFAIAEGASVLDLGCGPGNIAFILGEIRPDLFVVGWDGARAMIEIAQSRLVSPARISFEAQQIPASDEARHARFDAIISNSLLHHLHDPQVLWNAVRTHGRPGAVVFMQDLRRPETPEAAETMVRVLAADDPPVLQRDFLASLHAAFEPAEVVAQLAEAGLAAFAVESHGERHLRIAGHLT